MYVKSFYLTIYLFENKFLWKNGSVIVRGFNKPSLLAITVASLHSVINEMVIYDPEEYSSEFYEFRARFYGTGRRRDKTSIDYVRYRVYRHSESVTIRLLGGNRHRSQVGV